MKIKYDNYKKDWEPLAISYIRWNSKNPNKQVLEQQWYCHETGETIWNEIPVEK